ncbi:MAG: non-canonical purine NTP pyrophosphatase, RdgB/HAM1 family [Rhodospirillaceae bacterium]|nr:non-canonical purine NTP pyrophosphatase, RdgB/HAM1 family [Rhodospirillaceae bacterium]|tara:strand:+ start:369 stop:983 length:615 start_codon:yes stop_codon:yes gene_type:complete
MGRKFIYDQLVIASHNLGKIDEITELMAPLGITVRNSVELQLPEPIEDGLTFTENATIKAISASNNTGLPALSDDSGLSINALSGAPGIYSARWAETNNGRDFNVAMERIHNELIKHDDLTAQFTCALALSWPDGHIETFEGILNGKIIWPPRGTKGFGYDPIFQKLGDSRTFGEIEPMEKQNISHRAIAFNKMLESCFLQKDD